jgi:hypothetical protein
MSWFSRTNDMLNNLTAQRDVAEEKARGWEDMYEAANRMYCEAHSDKCRAESELHRLRHDYEKLKADRMKLYHDYMRYEVWGTAVPYEFNMIRRVMNKPIEELNINGNNCGDRQKINELVRAVNVLREAAPCEDYVANHSFEWAVQQAKDGHKVTRGGWVSISYAFLRVGDVMRVRYTHGEEVPLHIDASDLMSDWRLA